MRLGISAPENLAVFRKEVWLQVCQQAIGPDNESVIEK